jgi:hypothetical protein
LARKKALKLGCREYKTLPGQLRRTATSWMKEGSRHDPARLVFASDMIQFEDNRSRRQLDESWSPPLRGAGSGRGAASLRPEVDMFSDGEKGLDNEKDFANSIYQSPIWMISRWLPAARKLSIDLFLGEMVNFCCWEMDSPSTRPLGGSSCGSTHLLWFSG